MWWGEAVGLAVAPALRMHRQGRDDEMIQVAGQFASRS
jgi:hypothetical protein